MSKTKPESPMDVHPAFQLFQRIRQCEGERIHWEKEGLRTTYFVFSRNYTALRELVQRLESPETKPLISGVDKREIQTTLLMENMRHLHNFLAGAITLVDHTRVLVKKLYSDHPFRCEYQDKLNEIFSASGPAGLVKGLRNWMSHRSIVPLAFTWTLGTGGFNLAIVLSLDELRAYDHWDGRTRQFLKTMSSDPRLLDVATVYHDHVEQFYRWLDQRMSEIHEHAFREWRDLQAQYLAAHGPPPPIKM